MSGRCPECGASLPSSGDCRDHFHALLAREWQIPGGPGELAHFYAVAAYGLQHPCGMGYTRETVAGLRRAVNDALAGSASIPQLRHQARAVAERQGRVTRRPGDPEVRWPIARWPMTIVDVLPAITDQTQYVERASEWARSILALLDAESPAA